MTLRLRPLSNVSVDFSTGLVFYWISIDDDVDGIDIFCFNLMGLLYLSLAHLGILLMTKYLRGITIMDWKAETWWDFVGAKKQDLEMARRMV